MFGHNDYKQGEAGTYLIKRGRVWCILNINRQRPRLGQSDFKKAQDGQYYTQNWSCCSLRKRVSKLQGHVRLNLEVKLIQSGEVFVASLAQAFEAVAFGEQTLALLKHDAQVVDAVTVGYLLPALDVPLGNVDNLEHSK